MALLDAVRALFDDKPTYNAREVDAKLLNAIDEGLAVANQGGPLIKVRPPRSSDGMDASLEMFETFHSVEKGFRGFGNHSPSYTHEVWFYNGTIQFFLRPERTTDQRIVKAQLRNSYPNADFGPAEEQFLSVEEGDYLAAATLHLSRAFYFPLKAPLGPQDFDVDPYAAVTSSMVLEDDHAPDGTQLIPNECQVLVQTTFTPAKPDWSMGREVAEGTLEILDARLCGANAREIAEERRGEKLTGNIVSGYGTRKATNAERHEADIIEQQHGKKGFYISLRILVASPYKLVAEQRAKEVAGTFRRYDSDVTEQQLVATPIDPDEIPNLANTTAARRQHVSLSHRRKAQKFVATVEELAALAHLPNEEINTPMVDWATGETGPGVATEIKQPRQVDVPESGSEDVDDDFESEFGGEISNI